MQTLPPPPPQVQCVAPEHANKTWGYLVLSGEPAQLDAAVAEVAPGWLLESKAVNNGVAFARLKHSADVKYRALIIKAQQRGLSVSVFTMPPICGMDNQ
jgi:hypothetical protein